MDRVPSKERESQNVARFSAMSWQLTQLPKQVVQVPEKNWRVSSAPNGINISQPSGMHIMNVQTSGTELIVTMGQEQGVLDDENARIIIDAVEPLVREAFRQVPRADRAPDVSQAQSLEQSLNLKVHQLLAGSQ